MKIPPYLNPGDKIGITCPASKMDRGAAIFAASVMRSWGFESLVGETVGPHFHNFSAPDEKRRRELQGMLDDDGIRAILFGRGGYGMLRILDQLDFTKFRESPKWICGYSDITAMHLHVNTRFGIATLHSLMCSGITSETCRDPYVRSLRSALLGEKIIYRFIPGALSRPGLAEGPLCGGNLSMLANLSGTVSQPDTRGKILFIEDVGEFRYAIDRMMINLKRAGWLDQLAGLVVGNFTAGRETDTPFGQTEYEIVWDKIKEFGYPVAFGFPVGHGAENFALKEGVPYALEVDREGVLMEI